MRVDKVLSLLILIYSASTNQETLAGESSGMAAIVNYENVESATFLGNRSITPTIVTDDQQDHTYDTPEFHSQTEMLHEQPQYNTLQHGNNGKITNYGMRFDAYDKVEIHASKHACNCSTFIKQASRSIHQTDSYYYDVGATFTHENKMERVPQMVPQDYVIEPVYHEPNNTQADKPTYKQPVFDDEAYGMHKQVSNGAVVQPGIDSFESKSHSEITTTVKEDMPTDNKEVEYAEPLAPNDKSHTQDTQGKGEHFYHSLELNEPIKSEKCISGAPLSNKSSNPSLTMEEKMQTLHHILSPEEASCIGDVNDDPELLNYEEDTNALEYSDPLDSECTDDINMAKDQRDTIAKFNIYDIFDDSTHA